MTVTLTWPLVAVVTLIVAVALLVSGVPFMLPSPWADVLAIVLMVVVGVAVVYLFSFFVLLFAVAFA